jgi:hypothetical protein
LREKRKTKRGKDGSKTGKKAKNSKISRAHRRSHPPKLRRIPKQSEEIPMPVEETIKRADEQIRPGLEMEEGAVRGHPSRRGRGQAGVRLLHWEWCRWCSTFRARGGGVKANDGQSEEAGHGRLKAGRETG